MHSPTGIGVDPVDGDEAALAASQVLEGKKEGGEALCRFAVRRTDTDVPPVSQAQRDMAIVLLEKLSISLTTTTNRIDLVSSVHLFS